MSQLRIEPIFTAEFYGAALWSTQELRLRFKGVADMGVAEKLDTFLQQVHDKVLAADADVVVDFMELEFMNSSCFKKFVSWISKLKPDEAGQKKVYKVCFLTNPKLSWQIRSLKALACFALTQVSIKNGALEKAET